MSAAKHTPGPWVVNDLYAETEIRGPQNSGAMICVMSPWGIAADEPDPQRANARLIAAAPDLLEALREYDAAFTEFDPDSRDSRHRMRLATIKARAAIARATGSAA